MTETGSLTLSIVNVLCWGLDISKMPQFHPDPSAKGTVSWELCIYNHAGRSLAYIPRASKSSTDICCLCLLVLKRNPVVNRKLFQSDLYHVACQKSRANYGQQVEQKWLTGKHEKLKSWASKAMASNKVRLGSQRIEGTSKSNENP